MKKLMIACLVLAATSLANAGEIHFMHRESVTQQPHAGWDYVTEYSVDGQITDTAAKLKIVSREYYLSQDATGKWIVDYHKKGNVHVDIDARSNFVYAKTNGSYKVYTSPYRSDRTGVYQYNLAFILNTARKADGTYSATYAKSTQTDDMPYHEHLDLICTLQ
jgi:hypothetical protein